MRQLKLMVEVLTSPKTTFKSLPSDKIYLLAWLAPLYFGVVRVYRPPTYEKAIEWLGNPYMVFFVACIIGLIMIPIGAWIVRLIVRIFRKKLSVRKLMNIYGYSLVPRLVVATLANLMLALYPTAFESNELNGPQFILIAAGLSGLVYTMVLYVYGIVVSTSEQ